MLVPGLHDVPQGHLATVVTYLEMCAPPPPPRPAELPEGVTIRAVRDPDTAWYRELFLRVGGRDWLWFSRLALSSSELRSVLGDPGVEIWVLDAGGTAMGYAELDFGAEAGCELAFFGVAEELTGTTAARCLMTHAVARAFARGAERLHLHTCTLDHPRALAFYRRSGFVPTHVQVEVMPDPRLAGLLPESAGAHIPLLR